MIFKLLKLIPIPMMNEPENRCAAHPSLSKEFFCESCKLIYCNTCYQNDKKHRQKISSISEILLENYEFLSFLGRGSFGTVFKVKSLSDGQELALKVIQDVDDETFHIIKKESQFLFTLNHKNIVKYNSSYRIKQEDLFVILMELAEDSLMNRLDSMTEEEAFKYFIQICEALRYLHEEMRIVHRDLKPGNVLIKGETVKICNMGEAKKMMSEFLELSNEEGFGTENYLAPEVLNGKEYGFKVDIWALGIIFHKMLTKGVHPFNPNNEKNAIKEKVLGNEREISKNIKNPLFLTILEGFFVNFTRILSRF